MDSEHVVPSQLRPGSLSGLGLRSKLQVASLTAWLVLPTLPWLRLHDYQDRVDFLESGIGRPLPVIGIAGFLAATFLLPDEQVRRKVEPSLTTPLFILCIALGGLSIAWSIDRSSTIVNLAVTTGALLGLRELRRSRHCYQVVCSTLKIAAVIFVLMSAYMILFFPFQQRNFGGVLPNSMASIAFVIVCAGLLSTGVSRVTFLSFGVGVLIVVTARGFTLGVLAAFTAAALLRHYRRQPLILLATIFLATGLGVFASISSGSQIQHLAAPLAEFTALSSETRGLGSGLTGRTSQWTQGLALFQERPLTGFGFRTRHLSGQGLKGNQDMNAHSGFINAALDLGVLGAAALVAQVCFLGAAALRAPGRFLPKLFGLCAVSSILWLAVEPTYWSLSRAHWIATYLIVFLPYANCQIDSIQAGCLLPGAPATRSTKQSQPIDLSNVAAQSAGAGTSKGLL